jgi:hypothetical protein
MHYSLLTSNATNGGTSVIGSLVAKLKMPPKNCRYQDTNIVQLKMA